MKEKNIVTEQGMIFYWILDNWDKKKDTIFFFPDLTADHSMFELQSKSGIVVSSIDYIWRV